MQKELIDYIYSPTFVDEVRNIYINTPILYNKLIAIHCFVILSKTTGLKEGGFSLNYYQELFTGEKDKFKPNFQYYCYTSRYRLIENTKYCSNSAGKFKNNVFEVTNTIDVKKEISDYSRGLLLDIPEEEKGFKIIPLEIKNVSFEKPKINEFYTELMNDKEVCSHIENLYFEKVIKKTVKVETAKIKKI